MTQKTVIVFQSYIPEYRKPFFESLEKELRKRQIKLHLEVDKDATKSNRSGDASKLSFPIYMKKSRHLNFFGKSLRIRLVTKLDLSADLVILEQSLKDLSNLLILLIRKMLKKKTVIWGHGAEYVNEQSGLASRFRFKLVQISDATFVYTYDAAQKLAARGIPASRLFAIQNTTDTEALKMQLSMLKSSEIVEFRKRNQLSGNNVLYLGTFDESKNLDLLLDSIVYARNIHKDLTFTLVGKGPLQSTVDEFVSRHSWAHNLGRSNADKILALASSKVIVIAGRVGLVATDSFASGVPIVTVASTFHAPEFHYLEPSKDSLVVPKSVSALGEGISYALKDENNSLLRRGLRHKANKYSMTAMVSNFREGIESVIGEKNG